MEIFPAIDLLGGKVVRLTRGDYGKVDVYGGDPVETARAFKAQGAKNLHIVDLDGAKDGSAANFGVISAIAAEGGLFIQAGGGIRDFKRIEAHLGAGVSRVILGTAAAENFEFIERSIELFGNAVAVGVDARDGRVAVRGWRETTAIDALGFCEKLGAAGVDNIIYTDISRDGTMEGANLGVYALLAGRAGARITASGGISSMEEIEELKKMGIYAAILGKSLYTGAINLKGAIEKCR